jgi:hypothetical protein
LVGCWCAIIKVGDRVLGHTSMCRPSLSKIDFVDIGQALASLHLDKHFRGLVFSCGVGAQGGL